MNEEFNIEDYIPFSWESKEQRKPDEDGVIDLNTFQNENSIKLKMDFKDTALVKKEDNPSLLNLHYHFRIPLHIVKNKSWVETFITLENYQNDERIIFIKESEQND